MRHVKNLLILTLLFGSAGFLTNCSTNNTSSDTINVSLDEPYVSMGINATKDIDVDINFDDVAISVENPDLIKASYFDKKVTITSNSNVGSTRIKIYKSSDENIFKDILVTVAKTTTTSELSILDSGETTYKLGDKFSRSGLEVAIVTKQGDTVLNTLRLDDFEVFLSIEDGTIFTSTGKKTIYVSSLDASIKPISYEIEVVDDNIYPLKRLTNLLSNNNYSMSFKTDYNSILTIDGKLIFNPNYFVNTYMDLCFAKDNNGVFKYEYNNGVIGSSIITKNGYFTDLESDDLYDAVGMFSSTVGLKDFKDEYFDDVTVSGSTYTFKNKELLSLFWNDTLGFNGSADVLNLNVEGDAISYVISGAISSGLELTFTGAIYDIGTTKEASIEAYLSSSHKVGEVDDPTVTSIVNGLKTCNYTYAEDNFTIYVNPNYVYIEDSANEGNGEGFIEEDDGVYNFVVENEVLTLEDKVSDFDSIEETIYDFNNYSLFNDEEISSYYDSSYYGGYINFDYEGSLELMTNFFESFYGDLSSYTPFGTIFKSDSTLSNAVMDIYLETASGGMTYVEGNFLNIGSTSVPYIK